MPCGRHPASLLLVVLQCVDLVESISEDDHGLKDLEDRRRPGLEVEVEVTQLGPLRDVANEVPDATLLVVGQAEVLEDVVQDVAQGEPGLLLRGGEDVSDGRDPVVLAVLKDVDDASATSTSSASAK